jgi:adenosylhomocysteine nucleosidase
MERAKIGIVTGLKAEAAWLARSGFLVRAGGGTPRGAEAAARQLLKDGALALISFGLAGGLRPGVKPGTVLVPSSVVDGRAVYPCDYRLMEFLGGSTGTSILAASKIAATAHEKSLLYRRLRAVAVDLESGAVARVAGEKGLAFAVLRAIADPAELDLPRAAVSALDDEGRVRLGFVLCSILREPGQLPGLIKVGRDAKAARAALLERLKRLPERSL